MSAPITLLETEWDLLLVVCSQLSRHDKLERIGRFVRTPIRWESLLARADEHGVASLLYQSFSEISGEIPAEEWHSLKRRHQLNLHKALLLARELIRILDRLDTLAIEVMPYKGLTLAEAIYGDIALRQSGDIDLLIHVEDLPRIKSAVGELGYTPHLPLTEAEERAYLDSGYECTFDSESGRNLLELQWALQPRFYAVELRVEDLFQRAATVSVAGRGVKTPAPEDLLLILSLHAAKHAWGRLIWLCDVSRIMSLASLNWNWIENEASRLGIVRILRVTMLLAKQLLGAPIPASLESKLAQDPMTLAIADEIATQIARGTSYDVESVAYFHLMMRLRERGADRMRFLQRLVFTPGPGEWKAVHLPPPLFPLYRLVRLSRLAARLAGH